MATRGLERFSGTSYQMPGVYNPIIDPLTIASTSLSSSWSSTTEYAVTVQYYETTTNAPTGGTSFGAPIPVSAGTLTNTFTPSIPLVLQDGKFYYVVVTRSANNVVTSANTAQRGGISNVVMETLTSASTALSVSWTTSVEIAETVRYYENVSDSTSGGTLVGEEQSSTLGATSNTYTPPTPLTVGKYYYAIVSRDGDTHSTTSATTKLMPGLYGATMTVLTAASSSLQVSWSATNNLAASIQYYQVDTDTTTGGTEFGTLRTVAAGITTHTLTQQPIINKYYYAVVQATAGGTPITTTSATYMTGVLNVYMDTPSETSTYLTANWDVYPTSAQVSVKFYSSTSASTVSGTLRESITSIASSTTQNSSFTLVVGTYYFIGITPSGGNEVRIASALRMPGLLSLTLNTLLNASTSLMSSWTLVQPYAIQLQYYQVDTNVTTGGTTFGTSQDIIAGTTTNTLTPAVQPLKGKYYYGIASIVGGNTITSASAVQMPTTVPGAPTSVSATRGDRQVTVSWTPPEDDGGTPILRYRATSTPGGVTALAYYPDTTVVVGGLTNGTSYTFTVIAINAVGNSVSSTASSAVTPATVPTFPRNVSATPGNTSADVSWFAPTSDGGSPILTYTVTSTPDNITSIVSYPTLTTTVNGLTNGTSYTFRVKATNDVGDSPESTASAAVTPRQDPLAGSLLFNGTSQYLTLVPGCAIGSGAFTMEGWFYNNSNWTTPRPLLGVSPNNGGQSHGLTIAFNGTNTSIFVDEYGFSNQKGYTVSAVSAGAWHHIALVRNSSQQETVFVDGVRSITGVLADTNNYTGVSDWIGRHYGGYWPGYITNHRVVVGTAVYDPTQTTITVPTGPLTSVANTKYLMLGAAVTTDSAGIQTVTNNGGVTQTAIVPF